MDFTVIGTASHMNPRQTLKTNRLRANYGPSIVKYEFDMTHNSFKVIESSLGSFQTIDKFLNFTYQKVKIENITDDKSKLIHIANTVINSQLQINLGKLYIGGTLEITIPEITKDLIQNVPKTPGDIDSMQKYLIDKCDVLMSSIIYAHKKIKFTDYDIIINSYGVSSNSLTDITNFIKFPIIRIYFEKLSQLMDDHLKKQAYVDIDGLFNNVIIKESYKTTSLSYRQSERIYDGTYINDYDPEKNLLTCEIYGEIITISTMNHKKTEAKRIENCKNSIFNLAYLNNTSTTFQYKCYNITVMNKHLIEIKNIADNISVKTFIQDFSLPKCILQNAYVERANFYINQYYNKISSAKFRIDYNNNRARVLAFKNSSESMFCIYNDGVVASFDFFDISDKKKLYIQASDTDLVNIVKNKLQDPYLIDIYMNKILRLWYGGRAYHTYRGRRYRVHVGPRGGRYINVKGKKVPLSSIRKAHKD